MFNKIISVVMSFLMSFTGLFYTSFNTVLDSATEMIFGVPYSAQAVKDDFLDSISDKDVVAVNEDEGYIDDLIAVFIDGNLSFSKKISLFSSLGATLIGWSAPIDLYVLKYSKAMTYKQITAKCSALEVKDGVVLAIPVTTYKTSLDSIPNDPFDTHEVLDWNELNPNGANWWLEAIDARQAWDYSSAFSKIKIGVVDAGYDLNHPELEGRISFPSRRLEDRNSSNEHGCHVAGIIGANRNNGIGISGICDNSELVCVDWYPDLLQFWNTELAIFFGFAECVKAGAKVVNLSLGKSSSKTDDNETFLDNVFGPAAVSLMMSSLLSKGYDFIAVQSAGNGDFYADPIDAKFNGHFSSVTEKNIFTGFYDVSKADILDRIIIVASADNEGNGKYVQSYYSNVGPRVDLAAPGGKVYSCSDDGGYTYLSGTSMAAPVVTGVASLVWSVNPLLTGAQVKNIVCSSTDSIAYINEEINNYYDSELLDYPMVNAKLAVEEALLISNGNWGRVSGRIITDKENVEVVYGGVAHTVYSDGTYSFVAPEGNRALTFTDSSGNSIGTVDISVVAGDTVEVLDYVDGAPVPPVVEEETTSVEQSEDVSEVFIEQQ